MKIPVAVIVLVTIPLLFAVFATASEKELLLDDIDLTVDPSQFDLCSQNCVVKHKRSGVEIDLADVPTTQLSLSQHLPNSLIAENKKKFGKIPHRTFYDFVFSLCSRTIDHNLPSNLQGLCNEKFPDDAPQNGEVGYITQFRKEKKKNSPAGGGGAPSSTPTYTHVCEEGFFNELLSVKSDEASENPAVLLTYASSVHPRWFAVVHLSCDVKNKKAKLDLVSNNQPASCYLVQKTQNNNNKNKNKKKEKEEEEEEDEYGTEEEGFIFHFFLKSSCKKPEPPTFLELVQKIVFEAAYDYLTNLTFASFQNDIGSVYVFISQHSAVFLFVSSHFVGVLFWRRGGGGEKKKDDVKDHQKEQDEGEEKEGEEKLSKREN